MWSGYNPAPGIFNKTYIDTIHSIIERASRHGIYVLLDMHQDCFSSNFCLYDGVPQWVANKSTPRHSFPWPFTGNCSSRGWGENCLTEAAATAYQDLYDNKNGMLDDLGAFWAKVATHFASVPAVLGYDHERAVCGRLYAPTGSSQASLAPPTCSACTTQSPRVSGSTTVGTCLL